MPEPSNKPHAEVSQPEQTMLTRNVQQLLDDGVKLIEPAEGDMACGEFGPGRLPEPEAIMEWLGQSGFLGGK